MADFDKYGYFILAGEVSGKAGVDAKLLRESDKHSKRYPPVETPIHNAFHLPPPEVLPPKNIPTWLRSSVVSDPIPARVRARLNSADLDRVLANR